VKKEGRILFSSGCIDMMSVRDRPFYKVGRIGIRVSRPFAAGMFEIEKRTPPGLGGRNNPPRYPALECISF
jgi:hypothetical protein